ncbi:ATP-grasp domain-containing protein [Alteribacter keqinensis]|uniref:ATP-grasp domain-containing protein n=1 Tax=Alteribacter keqinensis TaxID=2483800 RepID=A0A3M7TPW2_9BACI|nr:ATP-grasp domain-containing protein [Alteribacter keqinensis]RNA67588.1 ATP-grasp domain-containing protein [Alteribacter keqinensis]
MESNQLISLPNLTNDIVTGARKTKLCAYAVALEGWRRGLKLKWYTIDSGKFDEMITFGVNPPGRLFSLSSEERTHFFFRTRGDKVTNEAVEIGSDKDETKVWLAKAGVPVPEGFMFNQDDSDEMILKQVESIGYPLVLKPTNGSLGNGVITNLKNDIELIKALSYVRNDLGYEEIIVERYVPGEEYRVYVVEDKVIAAYNRVPANIIGDGHHTIEELIELKNKQRKKNARLFSCLIEIDEETLEFINKEGYNLQTIPERGKKIFLKEKTNVSAGGDPVDVTDDLPQTIKQIAIDALNAIPGLYHGGVDIIVDLENPNIEKSAVVIELNPTAQIGGILFPMKGRARDIPGAIIDYYFPETKGVKTAKSKVYFDLNTVLEPLQSRSAVEVEVAPAPIGKLHAKLFIVKGSTLHSYSKHRIIKRLAIEKGLHGFINSVDNNLEIMVAGIGKEAISTFQQTIYSVFEKKNIKKIVDEVWKHPVKVGFEIHERYNMSNIRSVDTSLKKINKEISKREKEKRKLEKRNLRILQSNSWKFTKPLRRVRKSVVDNITKGVSKSGKWV